jgi:hypothetical protein
MSVLTEGDGKVPLRNSPTQMKAYSVNRGITSRFDHMTSWERITGTD